MKSDEDVMRQPGKLYNPIQGLKNSAFVLYAKGRYINPEENTFYVLEWKF
jgi:hypothetical protein